jgi:hypothetical protein
MQEHLGCLFCKVSGTDFTMGISLWHCLKSDRLQRDLLQTALDAAIQDQDWIFIYPQAQESINWLLSKINALAERRNGAILAPIASLSGHLPELMPLTFSGTPNGLKLRGIDIIREFEWYEKFADELSAYIRQIEAALVTTSDIPVPWPDRPLLPTVRQRKIHRGKYLHPGQE